MSTERDSQIDVNRKCDALGKLMDTQRSRKLVECECSRELNYPVEILRGEIDPEDGKVEMSSRRGARTQLTPMRATEPADDD